MKGGAYLAIGVAIGVALGVALDNLALWLALGVAIGTALSAATWGKTPSDAATPPQSIEGDEEKR